MPIYEYRCASGHSFETFQSMSEDPISSCVECAAPSERVLSAPAVHFKGSGFYTTDYARKGKQGSGSDDGGSDSSPSSEKSPEKSSEKSSEQSSKSEKSKEAGSKSSGSSGSSSSSDRAGSKSG